MTSPRRPKLTITRGLPASGKTTWAKAYVAEDVTHRVRVNRDDFRDMMFGGWTGMAEHEIAITKATDSAVTALLSKGYDVVMDNTFLPQRHARDARNLALRNDADFEIIDFTHVDLRTCISRDVSRGLRGERSVGKDVIVDMYNRYIKDKTLPLPFPEEPVVDTPALVLYEPDSSKPRAYLVDIDGTVALMCGRSPYDESRVHEDRPNKRVIEVIQGLWHCGAEIIFVSGRHDVCEQATREWIDEHTGVSYKLFMRAANDNRKDSIIKREIFDKHIRHNYNVLGCFDDRQQVVDAYREIGLTVFQVAPGNF